jgi:cold shock CspA family protein
MSADKSSFDTEHQYVGRVKWFNNKSGYGFITSCDDKNKDEDVFVHHSGVNVDEDQYRYLVQGEYVEFKLASTPGESKYPYQASHVTGMWGGKLMCETMNERPKKQKKNKTPREQKYTASQPSQ